MRKVWLLAVLLTMACGASPTPTSPSSTTPNAVVDAPTQPTSAAPVPVPAPTAPVPVPVPQPCVNPRYFTQVTFINDGKSLTIHNGGNCAVDYLLGIFSIPNGNQPTNQTQAGLQDAHLAAGTTGSYFWPNIPLCYQVDVWDSLSQATINGRSLFTIPPIASTVSINSTCKLSVVTNPDPIPVPVVTSPDPIPLCQHPKEHHCPGPTTCHSPECAHAHCHDRK